MPDIDAMLRQVDHSLDRSAEKLIELISIPSISNDPSATADVKRAAEWLSHELAAIGLPARIVSTEGHPVVLARSPERSEAAMRRLLFYGHYDVQPIGDLSLWKHEPFSSRIVEEAGLKRIYGRGASDSKSQLWTLIEALRVWKSVDGEFPAAVTIMLEGEEECGSPSLPAFLDTHREELACEVAFICDAEMWSRAQPAITTRLKGLLHERVTISTPNPELHSGHYGAVAANPIRILSQILSGLHDERGRVVIDGFYDGVREIPPDIRDQWNELAKLNRLDDEIDLRGGVIEQGFTPVEAMWGRPVLDINGITGGNQGPGGRSVLPSTATARLTFRLVDGQDPEHIRQQFRRHVEGLLPEGCTVTFEGEGGSRAIVLTQDDPFLQAAARGLAAEWGNPTVLRATGGAIPLVQQLSETLDTACVVVGFILPDDAIHAPDERYDVERLRQGVRGWIRVFEEIDRIERS